MPHYGFNLQVEDTSPDNFTQRRQTSSPQHQDLTAHQHLPQLHLHTDTPPWFFQAVQQTAQSS